jgi:hypothetical protein
MKIAKINFEIIEFFGLTVVAPAVIYWLFRHHFSVDWEGGEGLLAGFLGVTGLVTFVARHH